MSSSSDLPVVGVADSHVAKWLAQEPEMDIALVFTASGRARLWGALMHEWLDAVFTLSDPGVAQAKLAWWGESLASTDSAHPLIQAFRHEARDAVTASHWRALTETALSLSTLDASPADVAALLTSRLPLAAALVDIETALWPEAGAADVPTTARSLVLHQWRRHRAGEIAQPAWLPLQLLARHELRAQSAYALEDTAACNRLFSDLAAALLQTKSKPAGSRLRRIRTRLDERALARLWVGRKPPFLASGFGVLWHSWQAARGVSA